MRFKLFVILFVFLLYPVCGDNTTSSDATIKSAVKWESFNSGLTKALKENKHIMIDFYADWCMWCRVMDRDTFSNEEIIKILNDNFVAIRLDTENHETITYMDRTATPNQFASMLGISGLPSVAFLDSNGQYIDKISGFIKADIFSGILKYINEGCYKKQIALADYMKKKTDCK